MIGGAADTPALDSVSRLFSYAYGASKLALELSHIIITYINRHYQLG